MPILLLKLGIKKNFQNPLGIDLIFFKQLNRQFPRTRIGRLLNGCYRGRACLITSSVETLLHSRKVTQWFPFSELCCTRSSSYVGFLTAEFLRASPDQHAMLIPQREFTRYSLNWFGPSPPIFPPPRVLSFLSLQSRKSILRVLVKSWPK